MKVTLTLFASLREAVGERTVCLELTDGATVAELKQRLGDFYPAVQPLLSTVVFAVDDEYVAFEERLHDGASVAAIPPVSGGSAGLFRVTHEPLNADELAAMVQRPDCGAVTLFYGNVRNNSEGRSVTGMEYEAHESMALRKLEEVAAETRARYPDVREIGVWHRIGPMTIGETSLLVAVASPHRKDAFEACHWCVDRIKEVVPVWKKEHWTDGAAWVEGHAVEAPRLTSP